ncbi:MULTISPECIES: hypothetical protein [Roseiflexus]|jgi:hypothetical protein|uniref:Transcriptional regulator n=1 Tax=Roseiflexus castenholzii (strain DSM 13941 / HLO8) TaxID=383372 RepID=A7NNF5_ROSCS|nr:MULTISPECIES: hypothetical protein [Roseiflexus]ABU59091.1 conserved hypothetical protein [Roseiflexus castenholzii DSM 13941]GIW02138.1 MAG: hypothetical protein KatS3mg058_3541 [Roseiflexus sp.]
MNRINSFYQNEGLHRFDEARRKAFIAGVFDALLRQSGTMLSLDEVRARLKVRGQRDLGLQTVLIDRIVGSEGRYLDFDRRFLPRSGKLRRRWAEIHALARQMANLPPVELYRIGDVYFVRDGNHRISVARQIGQKEIDAYVTELLVDVPLEPGDSVRDLLLKEEYSDFLEWTELHRLRPDQRIEFSEPGGYLDLIQHINGHRYFMGLEQQREIARAEAVADWYDTVYLPMVRAIRQHRALDYFPGRTEADLYRWIAAHRWALLEQTGRDPGPECATHDFLERHLHRHPLDALNGVFYQLLARLGIDAHSSRHTNEGSPDEPQ